MNKEYDFLPCSVSELTGFLAEALHKELSDPYPDGSEIAPAPKDRILYSQACGITALTLTFLLNETSPNKDLSWRVVCVEPEHTPQNTKSATTSHCYVQGVDTEGLPQVAIDATWGQFLLKSPNDLLDSNKELPPQNIMVWDVADTETATTKATAIRPELNQDYKDLWNPAHARPFEHTPYLRIWYQARRIAENIRETIKKT